VKVALVIVGLLFSMTSLAFNCRLGLARLTDVSVVRAEALNAAWRYGTVPPKSIQLAFDYGVSKQPDRDPYLIAEAVVRAYHSQALITARGYGGIEPPQYLQIPYLKGAAMNPGLDPSVIAQAIVRAQTSNALDKAYGYGTIPAAYIIEAYYVGAATDPNGNLDAIAKAAVSQPWQPYKNPKY
jgi:hypothetical protein